MSNKKLFKQLAAACVSFFVSSAVSANPEGGVVAAGTATITQTPGNTQIDQTSDKAIVNWSSFNIQSGEKTQFNQPSANSITLNRIDPSQGVSQIFGTLTANGRIILVNQAGIYFGPSAYVNVGSIIAATTGITDQNFLAGKYAFDQSSHYHGTVINQGTIVAANNGLIALIGANVENNGAIHAHLGSVVLASGDKFTVDLNGDGLISFVIDSASTFSGIDHNGNTMRDGVKNTGTIVADGGKIIIAARDARGVVDHAINMDGVAQANSVSQHGGEIILSAGRHGVVRVSGKLYASGRSSGQVGGKIQISGKHIIIKSPAVLDVSGDLGGGEILVGGNKKGTPIAPNIKNAKTLTVEKGVNIYADALTQGNGGTLVFWSDKNTQFHGSVTARGGSVSGNGGTVETSGAHLNVSEIKMNLSAINGKKGIWLLDPTDVFIGNYASNNINLDTNTYQPANGALASSYINVNELMANLELSNIMITTSADFGSGGTGLGDITVNAPITWSSNSLLTLAADNNIYLNADITAPAGGIALNAMGDVITSGTAGSQSPVGVIANINVNTFSLIQGNWNQVSIVLPTFIAKNFSINPNAPAGTTEFVRERATAQEEAVQSTMAYTSDLAGGGEGAHEEEDSGRDVSGVMLVSQNINSISAKQDRAEARELRQQRFTTKGGNLLMIQ